MAILNIFLLATVYNNEGNYKHYFKLTEDSVYVCKLIS